MNNCCLRKDSSGASSAIISSIEVSLTRLERIVESAHTHRSEPSDKTSLPRRADFWNESLQEKNRGESTEEQDRDAEKGEPDQCDWTVVIVPLIPWESTAKGGEYGNIKERIDALGKVRMKVLGSKEQLAESRHRANVHSSSLLFHKSNMRGARLNQSG